MFDAAGAQRPAHGERVCGDVFAIVPCDGALLVAVADGLGHGPDAAAAGDAFCAMAAARAREPLDAIMREADRVMRATRGAAAALLRLDPASAVAQFLGVGNIGVVAATGAQFPAVSTPGILGRRPARLRATSATLRAGDAFMLYSDGIVSGVERAQIPAGAADGAARAVLAAYARAHDDATCVVVRCVAHGA